MSFLPVAPLSPLSGKSNVVQRGHVRWNNGSKILNKGWKGATVWMTIGQNRGWGLMMWGETVQIDDRSPLVKYYQASFLCISPPPILFWYHTENGKMLPDNDLLLCHFLFVYQPIYLLLRHSPSLWVHNTDGLGSHSDGRWMPSVQSEIMFFVAFI